MVFVGRWVGAGGILNSDSSRFSGLGTPMESLC